MKPPASLLDEAFAWFWSCVLSILRQRLRRNNFFFARLLAVVGIVATGVFIGISTYPAVFSTLEVVSLVVLVAAVVYHGVFTIRAANLLEETLWAGDHSREPSHLLVHIQYMRLFEMCLVILSLLGGLWIAAVIAALLASSLYFLLDFRLQAT